MCFFCAAGWRGLEDPTGGLADPTRRRPAGRPTAHVARIIINLDVRVCCFCVAGWRGLAAAQQMNQAPSRQRHMRMSLFNRFGRGQEEDVDPDRPDDVGPVERPPRSGGPAGHQEGEAG